MISRPAKPAQVVKSMNDKIPVSLIQLKQSYVVQVAIKGSLLQRWHTEDEFDTFAGALERVKFFEGRQTSFVSRILRRTDELVTLD